MPGKGDIQPTGQLGDVIKESALAALSWVQPHARALGLGAPDAPRGGAGGPPAARARECAIRVPRPRAAGCTPRVPPGDSVRSVCQPSRRRRRRTAASSRTASTRSRWRPARSAARVCPRAVRAHPPAAGCDPQGRPERGRRDVLRAGQPVQRAPGALGRGDDRRGVAARAGASGGWPEGEAHRRARSGVRTVLIRATPWTSSTRCPRRPGARWRSSHASPWRTCCGTPSRAGTTSSASPREPEPRCERVLFLSLVH